MGAPQTLVEYGFAGKFGNSPVDMAVVDGTGDPGSSFVRTMDEDELCRFFGLAVEPLNWETCFLCPVDYPTYSSSRCPYLFLLTFLLRLCVLDRVYPRSNKAIIRRLLIIEEQAENNDKVLCIIQNKKKPRVQYLSQVL